MSTAEIKLDIINKITQLKEIRIITEIQKLLDFELDDRVFHVSEEQKKRLAEAKSDAVITDEQANIEIDKWLQEK